jgi:hypothetical protein
MSRKRKLLARLRQLEKKQKVEQTPTIRLIWPDEPLPDDISSDAKIITLKWPEQLEPGHEYVTFEASPGRAEGLESPSVDILSKSCEETARPSQVDERMKIRERLNEKLGRLFDEQRQPPPPKPKQPSLPKSAPRGYSGVWPPVTDEERRKAFEALRNYPQDPPEEDMERIGPFRRWQIDESKDLEIEEF